MLSHLQLGKGGRSNLDHSQRSGGFLGRRHRIKHKKRKPTAMCLQGLKPNFCFSVLLWKRLPCLTWDSSGKNVQSQKESFWGCRGIVFAEALFLLCLGQLCCCGDMEVWCRPLLLREPQGKAELLSRLTLGLWFCFIVEGELLLNKTLQAACLPSCLSLLWG